VRKNFANARDSNVADGASLVVSSWLRTLSSNSSMPFLHCIVVATWVEAENLGFSTSHFLRFIP
jgi:hypothetical protein